MNRLRPLARATRPAVSVALICVVCVALLALAGCSRSTLGTGSKPGSSETTPSGHMAGPAVNVFVSQAAVDAKPAPWVLTSPESAVRSYLAWVSYADRIGQSVVATPTMSAYQEVRVDSYVQYNLVRSRLLEQKLESITFGKPSVGPTSTLLPAKESWTYSYLSVTKGNRSIAGPYSATYDTTYTLVKNDTGQWVVDSVTAKAQGKVK